MASVACARACGRRRVQERRAEHGDFPSPATVVDSRKVQVGTQVSVERKDQNGEKDHAGKAASRAEATIAGRALRTGKATPMQIRSMAGRIESERVAVKRARKR